MDRHFDDHGFNDSGLNMRPSELFQRNCWISFEPVEGNLNVLADYIGPNKILWATDYPHPDGFFPGAPALIAQRPGLSAERNAASWPAEPRRSTACSNLPLRKKYNASAAKRVPTCSPAWGHGGPVPPLSLSLWLPTYDR